MVSAMASMAITSFPAGEAAAPRLDRGGPTTSREGAYLSGWRICAGGRERAVDTGEVVMKAGKLRTLASRIGHPAVEGAVGGAVEALTDLAMAGAFA